MRTTHIGSTHIYKDNHYHRSNWLKISYQEANAIKATALPVVTQASPEECLTWRDMKPLVYEKAFSIFSR